MIWSAWAANGTEEIGQKVKFIRMHGRLLLIPDSQSRHRMDASEHEQFAICEKSDTTAKHNGGLPVLVGLM